MQSHLVFLFVPYHNTGGHFIHWSLGWLSGQPYYCSYENKLEPYSDPVEIGNNKNFHHHKCDCYMGFNEVKQHIKLIENLTPSKQIVQFIYVTPLGVGPALRELFNVSLAQSTAEQQRQAIEYDNNNTKQMLAWMQDYHRVIMFNYTPGDLLTSVYNNRYPVTDSKDQKTMEDVTTYYESTFFNQTQSKFTENNIWDKREKLALILPTIKYHNYQTYIDRSKPHLYYNTDDLWNNFTTLIPEMLNYLNLSLNEEKFSIWKQLYYVWREKHNSSFSRNFNEIINAIVHGYYMDLTRYNMNFYNEVLIQHALIKQHNLNLKTWQLEKLPTNTQEIHKLLEPNIHSI